MSGFPILDLVIGMIFIYFLLSIICSSGVELLLSIQRTRAKLLEEWLKKVFNSPALDSQGAPLLDAKKTAISVGQAIMDHCMITALSEKGKSTSYISAGNFISALLDKITIAPATVTANSPFQMPPVDLAGYITAIQNSTVISGELKRTILALANEAKQAANVLSAIPATANITANISGDIKSELDQFRERLERWYDSNADRLTGKLKRTKVLFKTIVLAAIITVSLNADSVEIAKYLYDHKEETTQLADKAMSNFKAYSDRIEKIKKVADTAADIDKPTIDTLNKNIAQVKRDVDSLYASLPAGLPLGRTDRYDKFWHHIFGWLATILAICLGAPFWFDILNKIANLRSTGPKPSSSADNTIDKK